MAFHTYYLQVRGLGQISNTNEFKVRRLQNEALWRSPQVFILGPREPGPVLGTEDARGNILNNEQINMQENVKEGR